MRSVSVVIIAAVKCLGTKLNAKFTSISMQLMIADWCCPTDTAPKKFEFLPLNS